VSSIRAVFITLVPILAFTCSLAQEMPPRYSITADVSGHNPYLGQRYWFAGIHGASSPIRYALAGKEIVLVAILRNDSNYYIGFTSASRRAIASPAFAIHIEKDGQPVVLMPEHKKSATSISAQPPALWREVIPPHSSHEYSLFVEEYYDLRQPGIYTIQVTGIGGDVYSSAQAAAREQVRLTQGVAASNTIELHVVELGNFPRRGEKGSDLVYPR
jgi:hypothetical protein